MSCEAKKKQHACMSSQSTSVIKVSWHMHNEALKRRLCFGLMQFFDFQGTIRPYYKCASYVAMCLLVMSPCSHDVIVYC